MLRTFKQLSITAELWERVKDIKNLNGWILEAMQEKLEREQAQQRQEGE